MRKNKQDHHAFSNLRRILFRRALVITISAVASVLLLRELVRGHMGDWIVEWLMRIGSMDQAAAVSLYFYRIRTNMEYFIGIVILIFMLLLFWVLLYSFQSWFAQIIEGIDQIVDGDAPIALPPELRFVEQKLNHAKQTLRQREEEAQLQEQQKNDMIVYLAHDIRTPLTSVVGYLTLLDGNESLSGEQQKAYIHIAREKAGRLERLVGEFFELTRYHLQEVPLNKASIDLGFLLAQLSDELYPMLSAAGKTIEVNMDGCVEIWGDADKLARAFSNILKNAIAYSTANSLISVSVRIEMGIVILLFENTGTIPQEELETIFEKFYRANPARSSETGGAGLGLAIARDIIALHGGTIRAESANEKTVFTVTLPLYGNAAPDMLSTAECNALTK